MSCAFQNWSTSETAARLRSSVSVSAAVTSVVATGRSYHLVTAKAIAHDGRHAHPSPSRRRRRRRLHARDHLVRCDDGNAHGGCLSPLPQLHEREGGGGGGGHEPRRPQSGKPQHSPSP